ncbi:MULTISPECIES: AfsR/SARP family transcriptional regulator [Kitasatospora]|uniref:AfsR/SARP family transcriptional regulator n=1 Tax=Kitasatospora cathayae TaxID=3004092 RepID=A0ABY7Q8S9_9ACTN|nr:AfsR/SARP family transcriptional regulator [Kitasatospora sp. HUAS 3-15]WBP89145.1 AfsR/SARP family transcriptional regulator [Kitasatospora sp. HUAS 3-15]
MRAENDTAVAVESCDIRVLGPMSARLGGTSIVPTANKPRQLLALMALNADRLLTVSTLMDEIWSDADAPRSALPTLHTYILQLRRLMTKALGPDATCAAKDILVTKPGGYLLSVSPDSVDVTAYQKLLTSARSAAARGDAVAAARAYDAALGLWRGPALVDVQPGAVLSPELARLEENRLGVVEERIDAWLRLGCHSQLLDELASLTRRHPLNENLHAQFMTALYRAGRQSRAMETFQSLRHRLVEALGIEPSRRVRTLYQAMLSADPELDVLPADDRTRLAFAAA